MLKILLPDGSEALIDDADFAALKPYNWRVHPHGYVYAWVKELRRNVYMHRLVLPKISRIDHHDGNPKNNQRYNLRPSTGSQNLANSRVARNQRKSSKFKGVHWSKLYGKWVAQITVNYYKQSLGYFLDETEAARAYNRAAKAAFGDFARLNEISS